MAQDEVHQTDDRTSDFGGSTHQNRISKDDSKVGRDFAHLTLAEVIAHYTNNKATNPNFSIIVDGDRKTVTPKEGL